MAPSELPPGLRPVFGAMGAQIVVIVALAVCLGVAAVAAAFSLYEALRLILPSYLASGVLALVFLAVSAGLAAWLHYNHKRAQAEPAPKYGLRLVKDLALAGAITFIRAAGVRTKR